MPQMLQMQTSAAWSVERSKTRAWLRGGDDSGAFLPAHLELDHEQRPLPRSASAFRMAVRNTVKIQGIPPNRSRTCPPITGEGRISMDPSLTMPRSRPYLSWAPVGPSRPQRTEGMPHPRGSPHTFPLRPVPSPEARGSGPTKPPASLSRWSDAIC